MTYFKKIFLPLLMLFSVFTVCMAQTPASTLHAANPVFDAELKKLLSFTIPMMSVDDLKTRKEKIAVFDAREKAEYDVSHIPGAKYLGYEQFDPAALGNLSKNTPLVLYCSVGYRSEIIGGKLREMGYTKVYNLYGSIFEWVNRGYPLEKSPGKPAKELHTFNREWSKWVSNPKVKKVW